MTRYWLPFIWLAITALMLGASERANAHLTPNSEVRLSTGGGRVSADIIVPQGEYAYATGNPVDDSPAARAAARRYLAQRIAATGADGREWTVSIAEPEFVQIAGPPDLHARAIFTPPDGQAAEQFTLQWSVLVDTLPSHFALILVEAPGAERRIVGAVRAGSQRMQVRIDDHPLAVIKGAAVMGVQHIAAGYDHLLFLVALLLPAPLVARAGKWRERREMKPALRSLAWIVTAFTIGHSLTLIGATVGDWRLPMAPVEVVIALSVLISALHAIRPIFPGREPVVAGLFGLVHGLAFATLVHDAGAGAASSAAGLLGFNLGIELVQIAVVLVVAPLLMILSRQANYSLIQAGAGAACALAAAVWVVTRTVEAAPQLAPAVAASLAAASLVGIAAIFVSRTSAVRRAPAVWKSSRG